VSAAQVPTESQIVTIYFGLAKAAREFFNPPVHPTALIRWGTRGVNLRSGQRHKLALRRQPGKWLVSEEAIREFLDALTADRCGDDAPSPDSHPSKRRQQELDRVDAKLAEIGI
jgi:hypothetical protein